MSPPIRFLTTADGVRLAACSWGEGPPLVFVRGWMSNVELQWDIPAFVSFFEPFARHYRLVFYDTRGNGISDRDMPEIDLEGLLLDLDAVIAAFAPEPAVLYGQCFGGPIAIRYAARHPGRVSRLILDGTYARGDALGTREQRDRLLTMMRDEPEAAMFTLGYYTDPKAEQNISLADHYRELRRTPQYVTMEAAIKLYTVGFDLDVEDDLARIGCPTLVMHRRNNASIPFAAGRNLASRIKGAEFVAQQGTAANPWYGDAADVQRAVATFLGIPLDDRARQPARGAPVTIMFTDMESSTALTQRLGDAAAQDLLRRHNGIVRDALMRHGGREIKHTGDGIMASFSSPFAATECAIHIQRSLDATSGDAGDAVRVRIGLNAGEPIAEDDDLFGTAVQLAARTCAHAAPGQILVSNVVRELTAGKGLLYADIGQVELRGFEDPVHLYEVRWQH